MKQRSMLVLASALTLGTVGATAEPPVAAAGAVTVHLRNTSGRTLYYDATVADGVEWIQGERRFVNVTDLHPCDSGCDCFSMPPPRPQVRVLAPGAVVSSSWDGRYYEVRECKGDGPGRCRCASLKAAPPGRYAARLKAAVAVRGTAGANNFAPAGGVIGDAEPDAAKGACTGEASFDLDQNPHVLEIDVSCAAAR
jgi:hypothetical protein